MRVKRMILIATISLANGIGSSPFQLVRKILTPDSILWDGKNYMPCTVGNRMRYSTCTGACWFHDSYLAVANVYDNHVITYRFDGQTQDFTYVQQIKNHPIFHPEHLTVSPDGTLLALVNNGSQYYILLYALDLETHLIDPMPLSRIVSKDFIHDVRFSPDGRYLAYVSFGIQEAVCVYRIQRSSRQVTLNRVHSRTNRKRGVKCKGINFTQDGKFVVIIYARPVSTVSFFEAELSIHLFYENGTIGNEISNVKGKFCLEDVVFIANDTAIVVPDQGNDMLLVYPFNKETGRIDPNYTLIQNPDAQLSFPHGVAVSPDGNYLVATNYGDDSFNLYQIE